MTCSAPEVLRYLQELLEGSQKVDPEGCGGSHQGLSFG